MSLITTGTLRLLFVGLLLLVLVNTPFIFSSFDRNLVFRFLFLGYDNNIPAWYSSMLLFLAALLAVECSTLAKALAQPGHRVFLIFGLLLVFMSCDEIARFHEQVPQWITKKIGLMGINPFVGYEWLLLGGPVVIIILVTMAVKLERVLRRDRSSLILMRLGIGLIIFGGVVLESITGSLPRGAPRIIEILFEESFEMMGTLLICWSLINWRDAIQSGA